LDPRHHGQGNTMEQHHGTAKFFLVITLCVICGMFAYELGWERGSRSREFAEPAPAWLRGQAARARLDGRSVSISRGDEKLVGESPLSDADWHDGEPLITPAAGGRR
jgi:hypothetical protein